MLFIYLSMLETEEEKRKFGQLYEEYRSMMYSTAYEYLRQQQAAEDIVHEAFLGVIGMLSEVDEVKSKQTRNLLFTITKNKALNVLKHQRIGREKQHKFVVDADFDLPEEYAERREQVRKLAQLILELPENYQQVLRLQYLNDYSFESIAQILELRVEHVRVISSRARKKLKELVEQRSGTG